MSRQRFSNNSNVPSEPLDFKGADGADYPEPDRRAIDDFFSAAYEELRRIAMSVRHKDAQAALSPSTLINEAWLKLANSPGLTFASPLHFKLTAARAMRQTLVEAARRRDARKRGGKR